MLGMKGYKGECQQDAKRCPFELKRSNNAERGCWEGSQPTTWVDVPQGSQKCPREHP